MMRMRVQVLGLVVVMAAMGVRVGLAAEGAATGPGMDAGMEKKIEGKANKLAKAIHLEDEAKIARFKDVLGPWMVEMSEWHKAHDKELGELWKEWSKARSVVPKDEFPGEVIAQKIQAIYATLKPQYEAFLGKLGTVLTPEQVDALKEAWSRSPGLKRTYDAYVVATGEDLMEKDKQVIHGWLNRAREEAMLTDSNKEIVRIFKMYKVKVEEYIGTVEWAKLHRAYANKAKEAEGKGK